MTSAITQEQRLEQLAQTNPLFGPAKLKLGTFCSNLSYGGCISSMPGTLQLTWPNSARLAQLADAMKFEAVVPVARWRGFGGVTDANGESFESMTFAAAMAATTHHCSPFSTIHVPTLHPVMAAKQCATIDHISGGRFTLNITTGWNAQEIALFGSPIMPHDDRYDAASEWISLMKQIWTSEDPLDFEGRYYSVKGAHLRPHPIQPYPALMSAGASSRGQLFAAEHADIGFTSFASRDEESMRARVAGYRKLSWEKFGRPLAVWANANIIIGDSEADAQRQFEDCLAQGDHEALDNLFASMNITNQSFTPDMLQTLREDFIVGWNGYRIVGTKEKVVEELRYLMEIGVDGLLLTFPRFIEGMERFQEEVHPLLVQLGLRR
jgi:FMNH2-dependent dimethyl sulfone monooxygenase